jgi:peptidyl-prolyl cis-trans isomerase D
LQKNVLSTSYRLEQQRSLNSNSLNVANKPGTRDLLRWVLGGRNAGDISNIHEYIAGNKKYFIVAAISEVTPQGYVALDKVKENIKFQLINEKKGDLIAAELKGKSLDELKANENVKFSTTDQVEYKKATSVQSINADELVISAAVANMQAGEVSAPIKGNNAVYVVKVLSKEAKNAQFDAAAEADYIQSLDFYSNPNVIGQLIQETIGKTYNVENRVYEHM